MQNFLLLWCGKILFWQNDTYQSSLGYPWLMAKLFFNYQKFTLYLDDFNVLRNVFENKVLSSNLQIQ